MPVPVEINHSQAIERSLEEYGYLNGESLDLEVLKAEGSKEFAVKLLKKSSAH